MTSEQAEISDLEEASSKAEKEEYNSVNLSEVIEPILGKTPKRQNDDYWGGDIKWASAKDISQNNTRKIRRTAEKITVAGKEASNAKIMPEGTLVVVARGSVGKSAQLGEPMAFNQTCYGLEADNNRLINDFLYYAWQYKFNQIQAVTHGTIFDTITMASFEDIQIPLPNIEEQKRISEVLTNFDDKIENNIKNNRELEDIVQTIFESWFVDFDPYVDFKKCDIGEIPKDFEVVEVSDLCNNIRNGGTPKRSNEEYWGGEISWVKTGELNGEVITETEEKITKKGLEDNNCNIVGENTVLVALYGASVGNIGLTKIPATFNQACCSLEAKENIGFGFLFQTLKHLKPKLKQLSRGSAQQNISQGIIKEQKVALPPEEDLKKFRERVHPFYEMMKINKNQSRVLSEIRETLLPKLMSGEIRVNDINLGNVEVDSEA
ncbi:restriction endonuclease subunit S [Halonotius terrestris]|uniref:Restriction endonuclease subunit S n=1 Tax=Halonotius terrestris TaxID=2487750 RepID=A0A8J8P8R9_9EURY|nr:restriction endonuclease subunit S [Halonotius terrestris]TQQ83000.1 restriction endonuclease subunit S [Halonotius terrestris]